MKIHKLVFIGAGNMAEALIKGLIARQVCPAHNIMATDVRPERLADMKAAHGIQVATDNRTAVAGADVIVLAVKPQQMADVLNELRGAAPATALFISIAAGKRAAMMEQILGDGTRVVRVMPNTPALVGAGASAIAAGRWATSADLDLTATLLGAVGIVERTDEAMLDAVTALSGSGPAYVFYLAEAMLEAAQRMGMDPAVARTLTAATIGGAAKLMAESPESPSILRERVTSKGGTTAAALAVMGERGVGPAIADALLAAERRSKELSAG